MKITKTLSAVVITTITVIIILAASFGSFCYGVSFGSISTEEGIKSFLTLLVKSDRLVIRDKVLYVHGDDGQLRPLKIGKQTIGNN